MKKIITWKKGPTSEDFKKLTQSETMNSEQNTNEFTEGMLLCFIDCEIKLRFAAFSHCTCPYGKCIKKPEDIKNQLIYSYYLTTDFYI